MARLKLLCLLLLLLLLPTACCARPLPAPDAPGAGAARLFDLDWVPQSLRAQAGFEDGTGLQGSVRPDAPGRTGEAGCSQVHGGV